MWVRTRKKRGWLKKADQQKRAWLVEKSNVMAKLLPSATWDWGASPSLQSAHWHGMVLQYGFEHACHGCSKIHQSVVLMNRKRNKNIRTKVNAKPQRNKRGNSSCSLVIP
jgi:hypothetical protein